MKKLSALLFSLLLILSLAVPASAVGVSINDVTLTDMVGQTGWTFSIMEEGAAAPVEKTVTVYFFPAEGGKISVPNGKEPVIVTYQLVDGIYIPIDSQTVSRTWDIVKEESFTDDMLFSLVADDVQDVFFTFENVASGEPESPAVSTSFTDVAASAWYAEPVAWAVAQGITTGTTDTTFSPNSTCTTAQILTFLWRAKGSPAPAGENPFTDVAENAYYADAAIWAYENGLVTGDTFNGSAPCTRSATVTYLWTLAGKPSTGSAAFTDVAEDAAYAQAVAWAVEEGVTSGTSDTTFSPDATCTRGQIVTFLYRDLAD